MNTIDTPAPPTPLRRRGKSEGGVTILRIPGPDLCGTVADRFEWDAALACRMAHRLVIDLEAVTRIDPAGLRTVIALARACRARGGFVKVCAATRSVRILLALAGVHDLAEIFQTRSQAIYAATIAE